MPSHNPQRLSQRRSEFCRIGRFKEFASGICCQTLEFLQSQFAIVFSRHQIESDHVNAHRLRPSKIGSRKRSQDIRIGRNRAARLIVCPIGHDEDMTRAWVWTCKIGSQGFVDRKIQRRFSPRFDRIHKRADAQHFHRRERLHIDDLLDVVSRQQGERLSIFDGCVASEDASGSQPGLIAASGIPRPLRAMAVEPQGGIPAASF